MVCKGERAAAWDYRGKRRLLRGTGKASCLELPIDF